MKSIVLLIGASLLIQFSTSAQDSAPIKVKSNTDPRKTLSVSERYQFPQFKDGRVYYIDGGASGGRLNYNILLGEMHFIDPKGDTLAISNEQTLKGVTVGNSNYYYSPSKGYVEVIADFDPVKLAIHQILLPISSEKTGAYGQSSGTSAISRIKNVPSASGQLFKLEGTGDYILKPEKTYYLIDQNARIQPANKSGVMKVFARNKKEVEAYLKTESINFQKEEDLRKLLQFCRGLSV